MRFKLLSLVALAGLSGVVANQFYKPDNNVKVQKYTPRDADTRVSNAHEGAAKYLASVRADLETGLVDERLVDKAIAQRTQSGSRADGIGLEFEFMGPSNIGGRNRGLIVDNQNSDKLYCASVTGGVYISTNGGNNWVRSWNHKMNNLSSLVQDATGRLWVGTGSEWEGVSNQNAAGSGAPGGEGYGVYMSEDGGSTWELQTNTAGFGKCNELAAHPTNGDIIAAATSDGLYITTDGGKNWSNAGSCIPPSTVPHRNAIDVEFASDGSNIYCAFYSGFFFYGSDFENPCSLNAVQGVGSGGRYAITESPSDPKKVYALLTDDCDYVGMKMTSDGGETWADFPVPIPVSAPHFALFGDNCQANYDLLFHAYPRVGNESEDNIFLGGVDIWRYDGNWTQAATRGSAGNSGESFRMHVDHHVMTYDPNDPNKIYFGNDGGIYKSLDNGYMFYEINKGFTTTQFYGIDYAPYDYAVGGTQDNGCIFVTPWRPGNPDYGAGVSNQGILNGDGFDCAVSQIADIKYTTAQFGNAGRGAINSTQGSGACTPYCGLSNFYTNLQLWENDNDLTSRDSIVFVVDTTEQNVGLGTGNRTTFEGKLQVEQNAANIIAGSIRIGTVRSTLVYDGNGGFTGDGTGTLDESDWSFTVTFDDAPDLNARVNAFFTSNYNAGSVLIVTSATDDIPIEHVLRTNLEPGDQIKIQDPIQSIVAMQTMQRCSTDEASSCGANSGLVLARKAVVLGENPEWIHLNVGNIEEFIFSEDGDEMFISTGNGFGFGGNRLSLIKGISNIYSQEDADAIAATNNPNTLEYPSKLIFSVPGGNITGISYNPQNPDQLLVSVGNYGVGNHIYLLERIPNTDNFSSRSLQGDLPDIPVYDAIFDGANPDRVILGTDLGVYTSTDITVASPEWVAEDFPLVPVFDVDQQTLDHSKASNYGVVYLGTHGAGIWKSGTISNIDEISHKDFGNGFESDITVYPNPVSDVSNLKVTVANPDNATIYVYDISGQLRKTLQPSFQAGDNDVQFNVSELSSGTYFVTLKDGSTQKVAKFVKLN